MLDVRLNEPTRFITPLETPVVIIDREHGFPHDGYHDLVEKEVTYQFRYVVHRQNAGFFTPVVFDVHFKYVELEGPTDTKTFNAMNNFAEPFIEGALFMNHASTFIADMLKGQEAGYNRKEKLEEIRDAVDGTGNFWYSDWMVPPITRQGQRIVVYDVDCACSMLDPVKTIEYYVGLVTKNLKRDDIPYHTIYHASIVAGYTERTV